jgi:hypothetical protein
MKNFKDIEEAGGQVLLIDESNVDQLLQLILIGVSSYEKAE